MARDGKWLEQFVASVERRFTPSGLQVTTNHRKYAKGRGQIAEFDVHIRGRVGTIELHWIIECRDRRTAADAQWIQACGGRMKQFKFAKVIAVSTSPFTPAALVSAKELDIELRTVRKLRVVDVEQWVAPNNEHVIHRNNDVHVIACKLSWQDGTPPEVIDEVERETFSQDSRILRNTKTGKLRTVANAAERAVPNSFFEKLDAGAPAVVANVEILAEGDNAYEFASSHGTFLVRSFSIEAQLHVTEKRIGFRELTEYTREEPHRALAHTVSFQPILHGNKLVEISVEHVQELGSRANIEFKEADSPSPNDDPPPLTIINRLDQ